ncbi:MAG: substrate-binding domain-containing protein [Deltaproteobacteria bacterium]|jgi:tungstate transport system substrate-binding protein|nr:substrate-binding domain-containing protein [Deltaproteobacteria bacterium]
MLTPRPLVGRVTSFGICGRARSRRTAFAFALILSAVTLALPAKLVSSDEPRTLILATTTSVRDSGLLDALLPRFTQGTGVEVRVIAVGTGAALRMGREGNADVLLTHAPAAEQVLVDDGVVRRRTPFMENFFVIAGPGADPADVRGSTSPEDALRRIAEVKAPWVSRSDDSGTHKREVALFRAAGLDPKADREGLVRTGSGMGLSLQVAGERRSYILSDIGTFLAFRERVDLVVLSKPSDSLRNVYSILQLDGNRFERPLNSEGAEALERYLVDPAVQAEIGAFGRERFGRPLFTPASNQAAADFGSRG